MDNGDPGPRYMGCDQRRERGSVVVGVYSSGPRVHVPDGSTAYSGEQFSEIPSRFVTADVLDVGAAHNLVCDRFAIQEADTVRLGSSNVQADDTACNRPGREEVCVDWIRFWEAVCTVHLNRLLNLRQTACNEGATKASTFSASAPLAPRLPALAHASPRFYSRYSVGALNCLYEIRHDVAGTFKPYREPQQVWRWPRFAAHRSVGQARRMLDERVNSAQ